MIYKQFQNVQLSTLGFGTMRLPVLGNGSGAVDQVELDRMVDAAIESGINYFDTAHPYHGGKSEVAIGKSLWRYPREKWYLADKFPGHQNVPGVKELQPEQVFEEQLKRCNVEYFDFYLLHNVNEYSMRYYCNPEKHCLDYFLKQRQLGRIKYLGFSCHAGPEALKMFVEQFGKDLEFCQIQLNYVDWDLQDAEQKCKILEEAGLPIWVMEPVRGGKLAKFDSQTEERMRTLRPEESIASWAFRWLQTVPKPTMVLSGMSNLRQMQDNIQTFSTVHPLSQKELAILEEIKNNLARTVPCTSCRYCCAGCPMNLDIPLLMNMINELQLGGNTTGNTLMRYSTLDDGKRAVDCIGCGQCSEACPQKIDVPSQMIRLADMVAKTKSWEEICKEREVAAEEETKRDCKG